MSVALDLDELTPEQAELQGRARRFVEDVLMPLEEQAELAGGDLPAELVGRIRSEAMAAQLQGGLHAREHGGQGWSKLEWVLVEEQFGRSTNALSWHVPSAYNVLTHGSAEQVDRWRRRMALRPGRRAGRRRAAERPGLRRRPAGPAHGCGPASSDRRRVPRQPSSRARPGSLRSSLLPSGRLRSGRLRSGRLRSGRLRSSLLRAVHSRFAWPRRREPDLRPAVTPSLARRARDEGAPPRRRRPVVDGRVVAGEDDAAAALAELGGPVAVKLSSPELRHKTAAGALALDLAAEPTSAPPGALASRNGGAVLVERMAPPGAELIVAVRRDAAVPALVIGLGGVYAEALDDVAVVPLPATPARIEAALADLKGAALLTNADLPAAACLAAALTTIPGLELIECNPVLVHEHGAVVVDAVARAYPRMRPPPTTAPYRDRPSGDRMNAIAQQLGEVGLPAPVKELAARDWDAVVVGGGHNGLTCAAYLAGAGQSVLVLERRERLGGACTLERPFADPEYVVSPCAYVVGLLDDLVIQELALNRRGLHVHLADPNLWVPFEDGTSFGQWVDDARTQADLDTLDVSAKDQAGYWAYEHLFDSIRVRLRTGERDSWLGDSPSRAELEDLLQGEQTMIDVVFNASIAEVLDDHMTDQRLKDALFGQGVIGAWAGPKDKGTASIKLMHYQGDLEGRGPLWGYVRGGMGMISFAIADAAQEAGAVLATGVPVAEIVPEEGVRLEDGTLIRAATVVCNADPKVALRLLGDHDVPTAFKDRLEAWQIRSPVVKFNAALNRLPTWTAAPGEDFPARGTVDVTTGLDAAQLAFESCARGEPAVGFGEIYVQTVDDPTPAPPGKHLLSVFGQYAPYDFDWDNRRDEVGRQFIDLISRFAPDFEDCLEHHEVLGPPDIEARIGLTGGNIFQGETMPDQMWEHRLASRTPLPGLYLCGAATHPAGSVIALNGRNAAMAVLEDARAGAVLA